jgi:hypothetical protein
MIAVARAFLEDGRARSLYWRKFRARARRASRDTEDTQRGQAPKHAWPQSTRRADEEPDLKT